jgi:hypothetical protein
MVETLRKSRLGESKLWNIEEVIGQIRPIPVRFRRASPNGGPLGLGRESGPERVESRLDGSALDRSKYRRAKRMREVA